MTKDKEMRLHRVFNIVLAALLVLLSAAFMAGCLYIYYGIGEYTREIAASVLSKFEIFAYICIGFALLVAIYEFVSPLKEKKEKPAPDNRHRLSRLKAKKDLENADKNVVFEIASEEKKRRVFSAVRVVVTVLCALVFVGVSAVPSFYHQSEITDSVIFVMLLVSPCLLVSGAVSLFVGIFYEKSLKKEIELLKKIPDAKGMENEKKAENKGIKAVAFAVKTVVILIAVGLLVFGAIEGGFADVMTKAVNICTECIGLG